MSVIDRRVEQLANLDQRIRHAPSFGMWFCLSHERFLLEQALQAEAEQVNRVAHGWVFVPPPKVLSQGDHQRQHPADFRGDLPRVAPSTRS